MAGGLLDLFLLASISVLKLLLVFFAFNPAFLSSNLAKSVTLERIISLWFMPVNILSTFVIGSGLGWIVVKITKPPQHLKGLVLGCCSAGTNDLRLEPFSYGLMFTTLFECPQSTVPESSVEPTKRTSDLVEGCFSNSEALILRKGQSKRCSDAAIPTVALIMGANLLKGWKRSGSLARVICRIIVRYMVQPAIGIAIVRAAKHFGAVHLRSKDPLYKFVLLLQYTLPLAMNVGTITQLFGAGGE